MEFVTNSGPGEGLIRYDKIILPLTKVGTFADMEITKDDRYILEQLIEKVTIQEIETKIKVLVHFVDIGLISVAAL